MRAAKTTPPRVGMQGDCVGGTTPREQRGVAYAGSGGASTGAVVICFTRKSRRHGRPANVRRTPARVRSPPAPYLGGPGGDERDRGVQGEPPLRMAAADLGRTPRGTRPVQSEGGRGVGQRGAASGVPYNSAGDLARTPRGTRPDAAAPTP